MDFRAVREMSGNLLKVGEVSWKSGQKLLIVSCIFESVRVFSSIIIVLLWMTRLLCFYHYEVDNTASTDMI